MTKKVRPFVYPYTLWGKTFPDVKLQGWWICPTCWNRRYIEAKETSEYPPEACDNDTCDAQWSKAIPLSELDEIKKTGYCFLYPDTEGNLPNWELLICGHCWVKAPHRISEKLPETCPQCEKPWQEVIRLDKFPKKTDSEINRMKGKCKP